MKQQIVPTSPKSDFQKEPVSHHLFVSIVIAVLFGSIAGIFGVFIGANMLSYFPDADFESNVFFPSSRTHKDQSALVQAPEVVDQVVSVYASEPTIDRATTWIGNAVVLTADGWLVMPTAIFPVGTVRTEAVVELASGVTTPIMDAVDDAFTGMTFFRVDAQDLTAVTFPDVTHLSAGQYVTLLTKQRNEPLLYERAIAGTLITQVQQSLTSRSDLPTVDGADTVHPVGTLAFLSTGMLAGVVVENNAIIPSRWIAGVLQSVIRSKQAIRTTLQISSINLQLLTVREREALKSPEQGIYVTKGDGALQTQDVIQVINGTRVDAATNLQDVVQSHTVGTTLYLTVLRAGVETPVEFVL